MTHNENKTACKRVSCKHNEEGESCKLAAPRTTKLEAFVDCYDHENKVD